MSDPELTDIVRWGVSITVPAVAGFSGVIVGAWLTSRRDRAQRRHEFKNNKLRHLYSPLLGLRLEIRARSEFRVKVHDAANAAWQKLCDQERRVGPEALRRLTDQRFPEFGKIIDYDNRKLSEDLLPAYRQMVKVLRENLWLAEASTRSHLPNLLEFVDTWDRLQDGALPYEVLQELGHSESALQPLYSDVQETHDKLRTELSSGDP